MERNLDHGFVSKRRVDVWDGSGRCLCRAADVAELQDLLGYAATHLAPFFREGAGGLGDLGVHVVSLPLRGRRGAIVDRRDRQMVLINSHVSKLDRDHIVAHEAAHLLLGRVQREGRVALTVEAEERLCEYFALTVKDLVCDPRPLQLQLHASFEGCLRSARSDPLGTHERRVY
jgi:hypothetical protein